MKKNVKNEKVLRAITIGLATMIAATSAPLNVFAGENGEEENVENTGSEEAGGEETEEVSSEQPTEEQGEEQAPAEDPAVTEAKTELTEAAALVETAAEQVEAYSTDDNIDTATLDALQGEQGAADLIQAAAEELSATAEAIEELKEDTEELVEEAKEIRDDYDANAKTLWHGEREGILVLARDEETNEVISDENGNPEYTTERQLTLVKDEYFKNYQAAKNLIEQALNEGVEPDKAAAWAEKVDTKIKAAQAQINVTKESLESEDGQYAEYQAKMAAFDEAYDEAAKNLSDLEKISSAIADAKAADEMLTKARNKAKLISELRKKELEVYGKFYSDYEKKAKKEVIVANDGVLDVAATGANITQADTATNNWKNPDWNNLRGAMDEMLKNKLIAEIDDIDPNSVRRSSQKEGSGDGMRFEVTYKDNEGNTHSAGYYNYLLKTDAGSLDEGVITLVKVEKDEKGNWKSKDAGSDLDDFAAVSAKADKHDEAIENIDSASDKLYDLYKNNGTFAAVKKLAKDTKTAFERIKRNGGNYNFVEKALVNVVTAYENSQARLDDLQHVFTLLKTRFGLVEAEEEEKAEEEVKEEVKAEAEEKVEAKEEIREEVKTEAEEKIEAKEEVKEEAKAEAEEKVEAKEEVKEEVKAETEEKVEAKAEDSDDTSDAPSTVFDAGDITITIPGIEIPAITFAALSDVEAAVEQAIGGVLGARTVEGETVADKKEDFATFANKVLEDKKVLVENSESEGQKLVKLEDNMIPLAETPFDEDGDRIPWIWLLIIAALGATGKKMYDEHKKNVQAKKSND